ncbi:MAG: DUF3685 domain-containing protein [Pseudanabaenaceae cyanobacterium]
MELVLLTDDLVWQMGLESYLAKESLPLTTTASTVELDVILTRYVEESGGKNRWFSGQKQRRNSSNNLRFASSDHWVNDDFNGRNLAINRLVLLLDLDWGGGNGWEILGYIRHHYSWLKVLVLGATATTANVSQLQGMGVVGCCLKSKVTDELLAALGCLRAGEKYFSIYWQGGQALVANSGLGAEISLSGVSGWRLGPYRWGAQSRQRLAQNLALVENQLQELPEGMMRAVLEGQRRELAAVQWLADHLLPGIPQPNPSPLPKPSRDYRADIPDWADSREVDLGDANLGGQKGIIAESLIFEQVLKKLNNPLRNLNLLPLEIDILQESKRRELLYFVTKTCADQFQELRQHTNNVDELNPQIFILLTSVWRKAVTDLLGQYTVINQFMNQGRMVPEYLPPGTSILSIILADQTLIEQELLHKIPYVTELLAHLFFEHQLIIDNVGYQVGSAEALRRAQVLLENLIITVANAVMQPILNHLGNLEEIKSKLYDRRLMPTREVEHFRNELTWKYRRAKYFDEPQAIFESRYTVYTLTEFGIRTLEIYAPRKTELQELEGARFMVTLALELQDALTPRLKAIFSLVGSGLVYVLTNVVGRGLGLIGRGILQGIGSALQDKKFR